MQRPLYARSIVLAERADAFYHIVDVRLRNLLARNHEAFAEEARLRLSPQVQHDFQQLVHILALKKQLPDMRRHRINQRLKVRIQLRS